MKATTESRPHTTVATRVAGEDIKPGDFVTTLHEIVELPSFLWSCSELTLPADEPVLRAAREHQDAALAVSCDVEHCFGLDRAGITKFRFGNVELLRAGHNAIEFAKLAVDLDARHSLLRRNDLAARQHGELTWITASEVVFYARTGFAPALQGTSRAW